MKISNLKVMKIVAYAIILLLAVNLFAIIISHTIILNIALIAIFSCLTIALIRIRCVSYESSGGCVTIRKHHPFCFKKFIVPEIEFPQNKIKKFHIKSLIPLRTLILHILSKREKLFRTKTRLIGFTSAQIKRIKTSLGSIVAKNRM